MCSLEPGCIPLDLAFLCSSNLYLEICKHLLPLLISWQDIALSIGRCLCVSIPARHRFKVRILNICLV